MIKTEEINLGVALFSVNTLRYYVTTNDIPARLSRENMISSLFLEGGGGGGGGGVGGLVREAPLETLSQSIIALNILDLIQN